MSTRETHVGRADYTVECHGCDWTASTSNAMGLAARHHDATGHAVTVEVNRVITYGNATAPPPGQQAMEVGA